MAAMKSKQFEDEAAVKVHRIRITLTSRNVKNLEKGQCRPTRCCCSSCTRIQYCVHVRFLSLKRSVCSQSAVI